MSNKEKLEGEGVLAGLGLGGPAADGDEYARRFLRRGESCPHLADLIRLTKGEADETTRTRLLAHMEACAACRTWQESYTCGWQERQRQAGDVEDSLAVTTSRRLKASPPAPAPLPPLDSSR